MVVFCLHEQPRHSQSTHSAASIRYLYVSIPLTAVVPGFLIERWTKDLHTENDFGVCSAAVSYATDVRTLKSQGQLKPVPVVRIEIQNVQNQLVVDWVAQLRRNWLFSRIAEIRRFNFF